MPSTASFYSIINNVWDSSNHALRMSLNYVHPHSSGSGGLLDWDVVWGDAVHSHGTDTEGGQLVAATAVPNAVTKNTLTTAGDIPYATGSATWTRLGIGTTVGQSLVVGSGGATPAWGNPTFFTTQFNGSGRAADYTIYQNTGTNSKLVVVTMSTVANSPVSVYCDSNGTPTQIVAKMGASNAGHSETGSLPFVVLPNYYYKVGGTGTIVSWIEWS